MLIFIDESGDAGFKTTKGSTPYFVIVIVIFDDELVAEDVALSIKKLRRKLNKKDTFEFKFNKLDKNIRLMFLKEISKYDFRIRAIVFRKDKIYSPKFKDDKNSFYSYAVKMVLKHNNNTIKNAKIRLDGLGEREFRRSLLVYLRKELNTRENKVLNDLKFVDSNKNVLIQLADMIAGSIRRYYEGEKIDYELYKAEINRKIDNIWEFK